MKISELGVKRPVTALMLFVFICIIGYISYTKLAIDMMPEIETPSVSVFTRWDGSSTEDMEKKVTRVIESALGSVTDLDEITSSTREGVSRVTCKFKWGTNLGEASNDVRDLLERAKRRLPDDVDTPIMFKFNTSNFPIMFYGITCRENREKMYKVVEDELVDTLKRVPGVGAVDSYGGLQRQINVFLDPDKLSAYNVSVINIATAIELDNQTEPVGNVKVGVTDYTIRVPGEFSDPTQINDVIVKRDGDTLVRISDLARVEDGFIEDKDFVETNGRKAMMMTVQKRSGETTVEVCNRVIAEVEKIKPSLPADYELILVSDSSDMIKRSISSVGETIVYGGIFVILTTFIFLRNIRTSLIITLTIPFSLIISFVFMFLLGWTINIMSLSALAVAIGVVVDNAVVILENIVSHIHRGSKCREASMFGADEVGTAVMASTLTTVVIFVPLIFITGVSGIMMKQLGGLVSITLFASLFCSLYITPMLASVLLREAKAEQEREQTFFGRMKIKSEKIFIAIDAFYAKLLGLALKVKWAIVIISAVVIYVTIISFGKIGSEFMGKEDTGELNITYELPLGTRFEITGEMGLKIIELIKEIVTEENITVMSISAGGGSTGFGANRASHIGSIRMRLVNASQRSISTDEYADAITKQVRTWPEITKIYANSNSFMNRMLMGGGANLNVEIFGHDLNETTDIAKKISHIISEVEGTKDVRISQDMGMPELSIQVDRQKVASLGLSMYDVTTTMSTLFQGNIVSQYREQEDEYDIRLRLEYANRRSIDDIRGSEISLPSGQRVRLDSIAEVVEGFGPVTISRKNQERIVSVEFDAIDRPEGDVIEDVRKRVEEEIMLPISISVKYGGMYEEQQKSERNMLMMIILGILLIYMVMASQFESFLHPFLIMFSIPFAFSGVAMALLMSGTPLSMTAYIGIILLIGIVVNNAIVLVDYINILRARGEKLWNAIVRSGRQRLRPVLITTLTTLFGMLPMALSTGDGSATWRPLGIVVVGGLSVSTLVTMIIVPVLYYIVESFKERRKIYKELVK